MVRGRCWVDPIRRYWFKGGYRRIKVEGKTVLAHRAAYTMFRGKLKGAQVLHHECENPECYNPWHLAQLSRAEHCLEHGPGRLVTQAAREGLAAYHSDRVLEFRDASERSRYSYLANKWIAKYNQTKKGY